MGCILRREVVCHIETDGSGLYLGPTSGKEFETVENGLYLMKQGELYDGRGLILGPNSSFKNIPILGWFVILLSEKKILTIKKEIDKIYGHDGHIYHLKKMMK